MSNIGVSVIITAYNRKDFVIQAIESVLNQNYDPSSYEIVLVTNFSIDLANYQVDYQLKSIVMDGSIGEFLYAGIMATTYTIIAFLDDDDTFDPGKLMRLMEIFSSNRELCYYHNDMKYVDHSGRKIDYVRLVERESRSLNSKNLIFDAKSNLHAIKAALDNRGDFNLSSMAIRRDCYLKYLLLLKQIKGNPDGFFFWTGIISLGQLMIDNKKLTNYRIHEMNVSGQLNSMSKAQELQKQIYTFDLILNFLAVNTGQCEISEDLKKWISLFKYEYELISAIFTNSSRASIMILIRRILSIDVKHSNTLKYRVLLFSFIAMINHDFTQKFYLRISSMNHKAKNKYK